MPIGAANALTQNNATQGSSSGALNKLADNFDTFLKLLTTQLKNQDPMEPMDSAQFTQQLVQYSNVEQAIQQNKNLESLLGMFQTQGLSLATSYIGKDVTAHTDTGFHKDGGVKWLYAFDAPAEKVSITVTDAKGRIVHQAAGETKAGEHSFTWDGKDANGNVLPEGFYTMKVTATDAKGETIENDVFLRGKVGSVEVNEGQPILVVDGMPVKLDQLTIIKSA